LLGTPMPVLLLDRSDVVFAAPPRLEIGAEPGMRVSLFPLAPVRGRSEGLRWPIDGLELAPGRRIGTSNEATARRVVVETEGPGLLVILPAAALEAALAALTAGAQGRR
ncbi:MAG: thiamine pyrophosphokinase, partial [Alphaproteobacteria bacterium]